MGVNLSTVNLDNVQANAALDAIPAGWYDTVIIDTEMKPCSPTAKDPNGMYMEVTEQIISGPHTGRKLFDRLNLQNANPVATEIAFGTLKAIYNAVGLARVDDSTQLHGIPHKVKVKVKPASGDYSAANEIQGYDHASSNHQPAGVTAAGVAGAPQGSPPWAAGAPAGAPAFAGNVPAANPFPGAGSPAPAAAAASASPAWAPPAGQQPWAQPAAQAAPAPAFVPPAPSAAVDPMAGARADGWQAHPSAPGHSWRGTDVVPDAQLIAHYAPAAAPAAPAFTPPAPPAAAAAPGAPWAAQAPAGPAAPAFGAPAQGAPAAATAAPGPTPPWAR